MVCWQDWDSKLRGYITIVTHLQEDNPTNLELLITPISCTDPVLISHYQTNLLDVVVIGNIVTKLISSIL